MVGVIGTSEPGETVIGAEPAVVWGTMLHPAAPQFAPYTAISYPSEYREVGPRSRVDELGMYY